MDEALLDPVDGDGDGDGDGGGGGGGGGGDKDGSSGGSGGSNTNDDNGDDGDGDVKGEGDGHRDSVSSGDGVHHSAPIVDRGRFIWGSWLKVREISASYKIKSFNY